MTVAPFIAFGNITTNAVEPSILALEPKSFALLPKRLSLSKALAYRDAFEEFDSSVLFKGAFSGMISAIL